MVQLIKKGGLRERANRSRSYQGSENTEAHLKPNRYHQPTDPLCSNNSQVNHECINVQTTELKQK